MNVEIAYSNLKQVAEAVAELQGKLATLPSTMVIYFASSDYEPHELSVAMDNAFQGAAVFGCTTAGEIVSGKMLKGSIVAMAFSPDIIEEVVAAVVPGISTSSDLTAAFSSFENHYHVAMQDADPSKYVGIVLFDGLSCSEERLMDAIGKLSNVTFVGGSAGDDLKFAATYVYANGKAYTDAAVLVLIKPRCRFSVIKTQSFCSWGTTLVATKVDENSRTVFEFNGKPAEIAYKEAIGPHVDKLSDYFMKHPLGFMPDGEGTNSPDDPFGEDPFVRSPRQVKDGSVSFYCNVKEGMELEVLECTNIVKATARALKKKETEIGPFKALINFNCILRTLQLENQGMTDFYSEIFEEIPTIGFSTYGEAYKLHMNQTATMLVFA